MEDVRFNYSIDCTQIENRYNVFSDYRSDIVHIPYYI